MTENGKQNGIEALQNVRVVLVEPTHPGNIGGAARAMKNAFLKHLWLVNPRLFPHPDAVARAAGAEELLSDARCAGTLDAALAEVHLAIGTSARARSIPVPLLDPAQAAHTLLREATRGPVALVFGRESSGLTNEELDRCQFLVRIPSNPDFGSLNLACAVQVLGYELVRAAAAHEGTGPARDSVSHEQMRHFYQHLERVLVALEFLNPAHPRKLMRRLIRLYDRARLDPNELNILEGMLTAMEQRLG